jgi:hypothetical protein
MTYGIIGLTARRLRLPGYRVFPIGGGGFLVGTSMSLDGTTKLVRTDTQGAYRLNGTSGLWEQVITLHTMPNDGGVYAGGVYEICVAPSDASIAYMMFRGDLYKSTNVNTPLVDDIRWTKLSNFATVSADANNGYRIFGRKMSVDPNDPTKVYAGTDSNGVWFTTNGGTTWTQVSTSDIPVSTSPATGGSGQALYPGHTIAFSGSSTIYVSTYGSQVRVSTNSGSTWSATTSGPTAVRHMVVGSDGRMWATNGLDPTSDSNVNNLYRFTPGSPGSWAQLTVGMNCSGVAVDPYDATHVVVQHPQGALAWTNTGSATTPTWTVSRSSQGAPYVQRVAADIPWLVRTGTSEEHALQAGDFQFDPVVANKLWTGDGVGVWTATCPTLMATIPQWTSVTKGIEQLVSQEFVSIPGGPVFYVAQDRTVWAKTDPEAYPSHYYPDTIGGVHKGWSFDYAVDDPTFGVVIGFGDTGRVNAKTTNSGASGSWTAITDPTGSTFGGQIAVSTSTNWVFMPSNNPQFIYYTKDGGSSWNAAGITTTIDVEGHYGWQWAEYVRSVAIVADRNQVGKFYVYNYGPSANGGGVYRSTDGGTNWTKLFTGPLTTGGNSFSIMKSALGVPNQLLWCAGGGGENPDFLRLTDTGSAITKTVITSISHVTRYGYGPMVPGQSYPIVFAATDASGLAGPAGIYKSEDNCASWTAIPGYPPLNTTDVIGALDGDKNVYGRFYVGYGGSGAVYYDPA